MQSLVIKDTGGYVTNIDAPDSPETILTECRGGVSRQDGSLFQRDFGTVNRFPTPPIRPNAFKNISGIDYRSGDTLVVTVTSHGYSNGDTVYIDETTANSRQANGTWVIGNVTTHTFELVGTLGNGTTAGAVGIVTKTPITIEKIHTFIDNTGTEYEIVVGLDSNNYMRVYVYDSGYGESSYWVELTRSFAASVNGTPSASATQVTFDGLVENGVSFTGSADFLNNWIVINTSQSNETVFITDSTATTVDVDTVVGSNGLAWVDNNSLQFYRFPAIFFNYTYSNGASPLINFLPVESQRKVNILYANSASPRVARQAIQVMRRDARSYFYTAYGGSAQRTLPAGWYIESDFGVLNPYYAQEGSSGTPYSTFDSEYHSVLIASNTSPIVVTLGAVSATLNNGDEVIVAGVTTNTAANGKWVLANKSGATFELVGSSGNGAYAGSTGYMYKVVATQVYDKTSGRPWLNVYTGKTNSSVVTGSNLNVRAYCTIEYGGYQESDPVFQGFYRAGSVLGAVYFSFGINFALMNKEVTAINLYGATASSTTVAAGWADAAADYYLISKLRTQSDSSKEIYGNSEDNNWKLRAPAYLSTPYFGWNGGAQVAGGSSGPTLATVDQAIAIGQTNISDALNHAIDINRSYPTPRFGIRVARPQGAISVIDTDDSTLRISNRNGDNNNEDDNFPDVSVDNSAQKMKVFLNSTGEMLGLGMSRDQIQVFKATEREWSDLQSGLQGIVPGDFVAVKSLITTPKGLMWAGRRGIYLLPSYGGEEEVFNPSWQNLYDGSLMATSSLQYMTDAFRSAIVGGYSSIYDSAWFVTQLYDTAGSTEYVAFVYCFNRKPLTQKPVGWFQRKLNIGTNGSVKCFSSRRSDNTLTIVHGNGILQYPNRSGSYIYQDDVAVNGAGGQVSRDRGIPTRIRINIGSLYGLSQQTVFDQFRIDVTGGTLAGTGTFNIKFYANGIATAVDTKTQSLVLYPVVRNMIPIGLLQRLAVQIDLTEGDEEVIKNFDISTLELLYEQRSLNQIGNK